MPGPVEQPIATIEILRAIAAVVLGASGTWLLLPHRHGAVKPRLATTIGAVMTGLAILSLATLWTTPNSFLSGLFFVVFALAALAGGVMTITSRNPVYCALWFASVVLSTSGLFLLLGAQFLAAGTIIVYAGAIIVTFLFVIMLAQSEGQASYDRMARSPGRATFTCYLLFWSLLHALILARTPMSYSPQGDQARLTRGSKFVEQRNLRADSRTANVLNRALTQTNRLPDVDLVPSGGRHVAGLGGTLFTDHLVTVELAGALLFVALIGALAIATPKSPIRPSLPNPPPPAS